jgi:hypothetical protein
MLFRESVLVLAMLVGTTPADAQHGGSAPPSRTPPAEASQFNFLVGQWDLEVKPAPVSLGQRIHGVPKLVGVWKAWRALDGWGVEDELRIVDGSGNPIGFSHAVRYYDATSKTWKTSSLDVYRGVFTSGTARRASADIVASSRGTDADGKPYVSRSRYHDISRDGFTFTQERSSDNGKTWKETLEISAKRVAAAASR